jgi:hypothetical protein
MTAEVAQIKSDKRVLETLTGAKTKLIGKKFLQQVAGVVARVTPENEDVLDVAMASFMGIKPKDDIEGMLASQMVAVHTLAMEMSSRALHPDQHPDMVTMNVNRATKLMRTYTAQIEALNKYRAKGQQKITVQHVNVETGGQAIVGDVNQGGGNG